MVYCGKPSKSCFPCRQKRTKCDLILPSCTQCLRTGRLCGGYRSEEEGGHQFRDQSKEIASKHKKRVFVAASAQSGQAQRFNASAELDLIPRRSTPGPFTSRRAIPPSLGFFQDSAACFFFNDYVVDDTQTPSNMFELLPIMYRQAPAGSALHMTLTGLGLACLSNTLQIPQLMIQANISYAKTLTLINSALRDAVKAKNDDILVIIILLGLFEEINSTSKTLDPWTNHVKGALALLEYRGPGQLERKISLHAISLLRMQVVVNCLIRRVEVPSSILTWSKLAREREDRDENKAESDLADTIAQFCNLQAVIESPESNIAPTEIVSQASALETSLQEWAANWQSRLPFTAVTIPEKSPSIFSDYWYSYSNIQAATLWNYYRSIRILLNQIIITHLVQNWEQNQDQAQTATQILIPNPSDLLTQLNLRKGIIISISHETCASVPFFLNQNLSSLCSSFGSSIPLTAYQTKKTARARLLIWPLYVAGQTDFVSEMMRLWVAEQLDNMGKEMGIGKAKALAVLLRGKQKASARKWRDLGMDENGAFADWDVPDWREARSFNGEATDCWENYGHIWL